MAQEVAEATLYLGETIGFWIQTGAIVLSAVGAIAVIYNNSHQAKKRATVDLVLHNNTNQTLIEARRMIAQYHSQGVNFSQYVCHNLHQHPENTHILAVLNNYEFIATGIKEGAFDEEIYRRVSRSLFLKDWNGMCSWVMELRRLTGIQTVYSEIEWLAGRWKDKKIPVNASIPRRLMTFMGL